MVAVGDRVLVNVKRRADRDGVWYEWDLENKDKNWTSVVHNLNGKAQKIYF